MLPQHDRLIFKPQSHAVIFHRIVFLVLLTDIRTAQSQTVTPSQKIIALVGEETILPCHLEPASNAVSETLEWARLDLEPRFVHVWYDGQNHLSSQNPSFQGRTSVSIEKLKQGDLSLKLSNLKHSDNGIYRCYCPTKAKESTVELIVGSSSLPAITGINIDNSALMLQCESAGWYPEPELLWLDGRGNLLSAGPTKELKASGDLYAVSSTVTVEKRHNNSFTCRVQQKKINQIRETQMHVSGDCVLAPPSPVARISIILVICFILSCAAATLVWKWRQKKCKVTKMHLEDEAKKREREKEKEQFMEESRKTEELQQKEEELKALEEVVNILMEQQKALQTLKDDLKHHRDMVDNEVKDIEKKLESVEGKGYLELKAITIEGKNKLQGKKESYSAQEQNTEKLYYATKNACDRIKNRKTEVEKWKETISLQLGEIQKQREENEMKPQRIKRKF